MKTLAPLFVVLCLLVLGSCQDEPPFEPIDLDRTELHLLNAYGPVDQVDVYLESYESNGLFASNLKFLESWPNGGYASLLTSVGFDSLESDPDVFIRIAERGGDGDIIERQGFRLNPEVKTSLVLIDSVGKPKLVKTIDIFESPGDTAANLRFMNLNYTMLSVSLRTADSTLDIGRLNFLNYSRFESLEPGIYDFEFVFDLTGSVVARLNQQRIEAGRTYSLFLTQLGGTPQAGLERLE
jgi:hypothetical protein